LVFAPGRRAGQIGVCICWDQWYPEAARLTALQGAEILFYPTAIGWHPSEKSEYGVNQHAAWETMQRSHAVANGCFVAAVNRVGLEKPAGGAGIEFWGQSFVAAPSGQILARASADQEEILLVPVDLGKSNSPARTGPSCATAASTPTAILTKRFVD
jgi:N-carbamoylputrescine amidase